MPISRLYIAGLLCTFIIVSGTGLVTNTAYAFDPSKVFEGDEGEMSSRKVFRLFFEAREKGQQEEAVRVLKYAADHGIPAAQWKLGRMYETGDGVERDPLAAFNLFKGITERYSSANPNTSDGQFASDAMVALGRYYNSGIPAGDLAPDPYQARVMFTTAAMVFGNTNAQFELGRMYLENSSGLHDPKLAARLLTLSYLEGHNGAKALLGKMIFDGTHFRANPVKGLRWLSQARKKAAPQNYEWIAALQEEAFALATPEQRKKAVEKVPEQPDK